MEKGMVDENNDLFVYIKASDLVSHILKIRPSKNANSLSSDTIKTIYSYKPSDPVIMKDVIDYIRKTYPSDSFGLILWSHATSWAPPRNKRIMSFGSDRGKEMDILDLKNALPDNMDYIIFDACSMASLEVLYEFRFKSKYILCSPSEVLSESYPYDKIVPYLFLDLAELKNIARIYYEHYNDLNGSAQSATISLIKMDELEEMCFNLRELLKSEQRNFFLRKSVQRFDYSQSFPVPSFDFGDFLTKNFNSSQLVSLKKSLSKVVVYKNNTPNFLGRPILANSGVTCYIPDSNDSYYNYYTGYEWYRASGFGE
ncbi:clostripain-related cysteine peptidase [Sphingobacterium sp. lm-10]|nr:clostripain-related cysteine peptidase [Sphingobacterium sp. lm-10]